jgi:hypothetical protein
MRKIKIIIGTVVGVGLFCGLTVLIFTTLFASPYLKFMGKGSTYYLQVAHACGSIIAQHPVNATDSVTLYSHMVLPCTIKLSGSDASLPKIVRVLHADMILVSTNRVLIEVPPEKMGGFVITWEPDDIRGNYWVLQSNRDGLVNTVYEENRSQPHTTPKPTPTTL